MSLAVWGRENALVVGRSDMLWTGRAERKKGFDPVARPVGPRAACLSQLLCRTFVGSSIVAGRAFCETVGVYGFRGLRDQLSHPCAICVHFVVCCPLSVVCCPLSAVYFTTLCACTVCAARLQKRRGAEGSGRLLKRSRTNNTAIRRLDG